LGEWESAKSDLTFARDLWVDTIKVFYKMYESIADFERKNNVQLPKDIAAMLT
jgi:ABC-type metal ion transport system substrate-binding protein